jgi:hypothetical protein
VGGGAKPEPICEAESRIISSTTESARPKRNLGTGCPWGWSPLLLEGLNQPKEYQYSQIQYKPFLNTKYKGYHLLTFYCVRYYAECFIYIERKDFI